MKFVNLLVLLYCVAVVLCVEYVVPPASLDAAPYADWAHKHWVWLSSHQANQSSELQLVKDYLAYDIPVGAVDIDSEWATGDNNFIFNTKKYPDPKGMISEFHSLGVKVILWATSMVNNISSNFDEGKQKGYFLNDGKLLKWWHGHGALLDYTNPEAVAWWHAAMDNVLDIGVDGFKCDGTDPYIFLLGIAHGKGGIVSYRKYADAYYGDFFDYTRQKRGPEGLIMSRPVDTFWSFSPRRVVFSGWVGDQDPTFKGLRTALTSMIHSAFRKYVGFGSDIGGYRSSGPAPFGRTVELFTRWFQLGAFTPLMENGGNNEHRPWMFDDTNATVNTYRQFVTIHHELIPYLLNAGTVAYATNTSIMKPLAVDLGPLPLNTYDFKLWDDIFVAPMTEEGTSRTIKFPKEDNWIDWWNQQLYKGGSEVTYTCPMDKFPVFHRQGSILPLRVESDYSLYGDSSSAKHLTLLISQPVGSQHLKLHEQEAGGREIAYEYDEMSGDMTLYATAHPQPLIVLIRGVTCPVAVVRHDGHKLEFSQSYDMLATQSQGWYCDESRMEAWLRPGDSWMGHMLSIRQMLRA